MDPEGWRMSATNLNFRNQQRNMTVPRTFQINHNKYLSTERYVKRAAIVMTNEGPSRLEGRFLQFDGKTSYRRGLTSLDQVQMKKPHGDESRRIMVNKHSGNKWANLVPNSLGHRENVALKTYGNNAQTFKAPYGLEVKKLPTLSRDVSRTFIPKQKINSQRFREDIQMTASSCASATNSMSKIPGDKMSIKTEPILVEDDEVHSESSYSGIPFHLSHKRIMRPNNVSSQSGTTEPLKRMKLGGQGSSLYIAETVRQKMLSQHRIPYKHLPTVSGGYSHNDSMGSGIQMEKRRNALPDETKAELIVSKQKDKSVGSSTYRRFLLIDSQGLPYTVVVEESKTTKDNTPSSEFSSDVTHVGASKSIAPRKVYKCPVCFRIFEYLSYLQRHSIAHSQQKPHVCKICGKAFKRTSHLTRHKYTHFGGKPCQCQMCHRRFRDIGELARHQLSHTGERPQQCEVCHMRFVDHSTLQRHMLAKH
ncbi:zinc finger protein 69 homolog B-like [Hyperolius riggenbachi]|uniref:zinc finger protein 69 homolog B-like n=1 Tax=Hyperolius riggenbachi TaxID=752182 RepID=UPI0035A2F75C